MTVDHDGHCPIPECLTRLATIEAMLKTAIEGHHERIVGLENAVSDPRNGLVKIVEGHATTIRVLRWVVTVLVAIGTMIATVLTAGPFLVHLLRGAAQGGQP